MRQKLLDILSHEEKAALEEFREAGLFWKSEKIRELHGLELERAYKRIITSLKDIRNCFAHSNGVVRKEDGRRDGKHARKFVWISYSVFLKGVHSGKEYPIKYNSPLEEESDLCLKKEVNHSHSFKIGEPLSFSSSEAFEIAWSLQQIGQQYLRMIKDKFNL